MLYNYAVLPLFLVFFTAGPAIYGCNCAAPIDAVQTVFERFLSDKNANYRFKDNIPRSDGLVF